MIYSTPSHLAVTQANVTFGLKNTDVPYTTRCYGFGNRYNDFFYGDVTYTCDVPTGPGATPGDAATFTFSKPDGVFNVNQTWTCLGSHPTKRSGTGIGAAKLDCSTTTYTNPNWTIGTGQTYSEITTTCNPAQLKITPKLLRM